MRLFKIEFQKFSEHEKTTAIYTRKNEIWFYITQIWKVKKAQNIKWKKQL